jgi:hypothetical protein
MDGLFIRQTQGCAAIISSQEALDVHLVSPKQRCATFARRQHKKAAGFALTRLPTLRHYIPVRKYVHGEKFSRSRWRLSDDFQNFVLPVKPTRPTIAAALMPFGACSGRGWLFSFVCHNKKAPRQRSG